MTTIRNFLFDNRGMTAIELGLLAVIVVVLVAASSLFCLVIYRRAFGF